MEEPEGCSPLSSVGLAQGFSCDFCFLQFFMYDNVLTLMSVMTSSSSFLFLQNPLNHPALLKHPLGQTFLEWNFLDLEKVFPLQTGVDAYQNYNK